VTTNRLEAFSDGVFAIAITLLVLEIDVPPSQALGAGLLSLWPSYLAYAVSFIVIGAIWINHHSMFQHIAHADEPFLLLNVFQLMFIAFVPFPTAVLAESFHDRAGEAVAAALYGGTLTVIGILVTAMWWYAAHRHRLLKRDVTPARAKRIGRRYLVGPTGYAIGSAVAFVSPWAALLCYLGLNVFFLWPRRKHAADASQPQAPKTNNR
jgi:uncharacterized membrane protein